MVTMSQGIYAAMSLAPELKERVQAIRADSNRRTWERYSSPVVFLEDNERDWQDYCLQLTGDPLAVPFVWKDLLEKLRTTPELLDHFFLAKDAASTKSRL